MVIEVQGWTEEFETFRIDTCSLNPSVTMQVRGLLGSPAKWLFVQWFILYIETVFTFPWLVELITVLCYVYFFPGKRKSSTGSTSSSDSCSSIPLSTGQPDTSCIEVKHRKISDPTPCRSLSSPDESLEETYIAPVTSVDYHCYLPSTEPYPQELDHYIVIEDPAEAFSIVSEPYSHEWKSKSETSPKSASQYWPSSTNANLTMPTYDWSSGNDYRDTVCRSLDSESVYSSINSTVSDYDYELPEPVPVAEEIEIETSSPHSPQPPKLETVKTLDMILEDIMNSPVVVGCEQATQTEDGLPSISTLMARWQT